MTKTPQDSVPHSILSKAFLMKLCKGFVGITHQHIGKVAGQVGKGDKGVFAHIHGHGVARDCVGCAENDVMFTIDNAITRQDFPRHCKFFHNISPVSEMVFRNGNIWHQLPDAIKDNRITFLPERRVQL